MVGRRSLPAWEYRGRWALVTGASAGIGEAFCRALARRGMHLVVSARRADRLQRLADQLSRDHGITAVVAAADLAEAGAATRLWERAGDGRTIDLLINNAGFGAHGPFAELPLDRQLGMLGVNCTAVLELAHAALTDMVARGAGGVVNVSSIAAFQPVPHLATYAATKAFVLSLSEALWVEAGPRGVRVLALCPGRTPTEFQEIAGTGPADGAFGLRSPAEVVETGLGAFESGKAYSVPGLENHLASWLARLAPRSALTRALKVLVRRSAGRRKQTP